MRVDLLITNGLVYTMEEGADPIPRGYVAVDKGVIVAVGPMKQLLPGSSAAQVVDAGGGLVMPGLVNAHCHAAMTLFRGLADDLPLQSWLNEHIFPAEATYVDPDLVYWGSKLGAAEMLLSGTTAVVDGYFLEIHAARAFADAGIRAVAGQGVIDFPAPGVPDPARNVDHARDYIDEGTGADDRVRPAVFAHSPYTCSAETLLKARELAWEKGVLFQVHLAETPFEREQCLAEKGMTPVAYLDSLGVLDRTTQAVHCVAVDRDDIRILSRRGVSVCPCPESNMKLASGRAPVPDMLAAGVRLCLGTDGPASNNDLNMFGEMRTSALLFKADRLDPTVVTAGQALRAATLGGADCLGLGGKLGVLASGSKADIIVLDTARPNMRPMYNPASHLVYAASGREVRHVLVDGRLLVEDGRMIAFDLEETKARVREIAKRIRG